jgi:hypothetical protein
MQQVKNNKPGRAVIYTDSKITPDSIISAKNHEHPVEEIRKNIVTLNKKNWKIKFKLVKAHAEIEGNETADRLPKEATQNHYVTYSRIPKNTIIKETREESIKKWQNQWKETTKETVTKEFFLSVERRLAVNLQLNPNVTTIRSEHGNIRSHLHRLKIIDSPECPCKKDIQTINHLIYQCEKLKCERGILKNSVFKTGNWPISESKLVNKNLKQIICYINSMELEKLNYSKSCK